MREAAHSERDRLHPWVLSESKSEQRIELSSANSHGGKPLGCSWGCELVLPAQVRGEMLLVIDGPARTAGIGTAV